MAYMRHHFCCDYPYWSAQSESCGFLSFLGHLEVSSIPGFLKRLLIGVIFKGVVLRNMFVQIPFPKQLFTPRTLYGHIRTGFWRFWLFPVCRHPSTFVYGCQGSIGFRLLDQLTIVRRLRSFGLKPHITPIHGVWVLSWIEHGNSGLSTL